MKAIGSRHVIWVMAVVLTVLSVGGSFDWAPASASRQGQTVPTFTPMPAPATPTLAAEPATLVPTAGPTPTLATTPAFLPVAGSESTDGAAVWALAGPLLLMAIGVMWRRLASRRAR